MEQILKTQSRRNFLSSLGKSAAIAGTLPLFSGCSPIDEAASGKNRPNVILIMTDDQGYGDLGCHGNEKINTPNLDRFSRESIQLTQFFVCPLCAPTRASLMTGRYNYRTGVTDVYLGRSLMYPDEVTIAEIFRNAGYETALFGKWDLGDSYPMRPGDNGFKEVLYMASGGQLYDYFDPELKHNGVWKKYEGYCTDIFFNEAITYIKANRAHPFFVYLSTNAVHTPLHVPEHFIEPYRAKGLDETTARSYAMITSIDDNMGRLLKMLDETGLDKETIVIFLTDNGPQYYRYNAGMRGKKGSVYDGGIRVPCFIRWNGKFEAGKKIDSISAHIDLLPTLLDACGIEKPHTINMDGMSLLPLFESRNTEWPDRTLFMQSNFSKDPEPYVNCMARTQRYKMVNSDELYDMESDPGEMNNIAGQHPEILTSLRNRYEEWYRDVTSERTFMPPRIPLGTPHENPAMLVRDDIRGTQRWSLEEVGHWEVYVAESGYYQVTLRFPMTKGDVDVYFSLGETELSQNMVGSPWITCTFDRVHLKKGEGQLKAWLNYKGELSGVRIVEVKKLLQ